MENYMNEISTGRWIIYTEDDGIYSATDLPITFASKKQAIDALHKAVADERKKPLVHKLASGLYEYFPKSAKSKPSVDSYMVIRITPDTVSVYQAKWKAQQVRDVFSNADVVLNGQAVLGLRYPKVDEDGTTVYTIGTASVRQPSRSE